MKLADWFKHYLANVPRTPENCELWDRISEAAAALSAQQGGVVVPLTYIDKLEKRAVEQKEWENHPKCEDNGIGDALQVIANELREFAAAPHAEAARQDNAAGKGEAGSLVTDALSTATPSAAPSHAAAPVAGDVAIVWGKPRQMWDGSWYRVGSSTSATLSPQDADQQMPGSASAWVPATTGPCSSAWAASAEKEIMEARSNGRGLYYADYHWIKRSLAIRLIRSAFNTAAAPALSEEEIERFRKLLTMILDIGAQLLPDSKNKSADAISIDAVCDMAIAYRKSRLSARHGGRNDGQDAG